MSDVLKQAARDGRLDIEAMRDPRHYVMEDDDLFEASRTALVLGKPLLLTGESGVGKSQFAAWLASQLGLGEPLEFVVKTTTEARDLFYEYDALARFHSAQIADALRKAGEPVDVSGVAAHRYLTYRPLGIAILRSLGRDAVRRRDLLRGAELDALPEAPVRSVVLIDEIDKAPRDVPNDLLDEVDRMRFRVRELDSGFVSASAEQRPVVVITSNSERDLPKPFLRRCIYYHMRLPDEAPMQRIVAARLGDRFADRGGLLGQCLRVFYHLHGSAGLRQPPGLAELLDWLRALETRDGGAPADLHDGDDWYPTLLAALVKDRQDRTRLGESPRDLLASALDTGAGDDGGRG